MGVNDYQRPLLVLDEWNDPSLKGLRVRARRLSVAEVRTLSERGEGTRAEREQAVIAIVARAVSDWNLTDTNGEPIEPTAAYFDETGDRILLDELVDALADRSTRAAPPLPQPSDSGPPSEEDFELMEAVSSVPVSSPGPS